MILLLDTNEKLITMRKASTVDGKRLCLCFLIFAMMLPTVAYAQSSRHRIAEALCVDVDSAFLSAVVHVLHDTSVNFSRLLMKDEVTCKEGTRFNILLSWFKNDDDKFKVYIGYEEDPLSSYLNNEQIRKDKLRYTVYGRFVIWFCREDAPDWIFGGIKETTRIEYWDNGEQPFFWDPIYLETIYNSTNNEFDVIDDSSTW